MTLLPFPKCDVLEMFAFKCTMRQGHFLFMCVSVCARLATVLRRRQLKLENQCPVSFVFATYLLFVHLNIYWGYLSFILLLFINCVSP